jgi:hypothetical protein
MSVKKPAKGTAKKLTASDLKKVKGGRMSSVESGGSEYASEETSKGKSAGGKRDAGKLF